MDQTTRIVVALGGGSLAFMAMGQSPYNMTPGVTDISHRVYDLHMTILYICAALGIAVFGAMFYAIVKHRKSTGAQAAQFHESTKVELLWTIIPFFILIAMAIPATTTLIEMEDNSNADVTIKITASQWKWHYQYFEHDFGFYSLLATPNDQIQNQSAKGENYLLEVDRPLVIPVNKKVRFLITADDVIHSWWVPAFAVKQDANPGFINEAWTRVNEPGIYRGQCAELCGKDHGFMPIVVKVLSLADYEQWLANQLAQVEMDKQAEQQALGATLSLDQSMVLGETVYAARCAACHRGSGEGISGAFPAIKGSPIALGDVSRHIDIVVNGKSGTAMQAFAAQLSSKELAAVITYERNAWGNNTGDVVQASDVVNQPKSRSAVGALPAIPPLAKTPAPQLKVIEVKVKTAVDELSDEPMKLGESVYLARCAACHQISGAGVAGVFPGLKGSAVALGDVVKHIEIVVNGMPGTAMQGFSDQLSAKDLAAVITYERNAWGNDTGDVVQASEVESTAGRAK